MTRWLRCVLCLCALLPASAWATQGEHETSVGITGGMHGVPGVGGTVTSPVGGVYGRWLYDLSDLWGLGAGLHSRVFSADGNYGSSLGSRTAITLDGRFVLDALQWIPSIGAGVGVGYGTGVGNTWMPWAHLDLGVDYRPARTWSVGARIGAEGVLDTNSTYIWAATLCWTWYAGHGKGLDL